MNKKHAVTLAELMIVMLILGIIATVSISVLKPSNIKKQAYITQAKKLLVDIDKATIAIITNDSPLNNMSKLYESGTTNTFNACTTDFESKLADLYKKYLNTSRNTCICKDSNNNEIPNSICLKNGACIGITASKVIKSIFPEEEQAKLQNSQCGAIYFDINGSDNMPNMLGIDKFVIPYNKKGLDYSKPTI